MKVLFKVFMSPTKSWDVLFAEAAEFAGEVGRGRLIGISHSHENTVGVVTVWYWDKDGR